MINKQNIKTFISGITLGAVVTAAGYALFSTDTHAPGKEEAVNEPLYWVAPMDANYKRDKPGKSPMGMDLIPVYPQKNDGANEGPGTVIVSPEVINNLGVRTNLVERKALHTKIKTVGYVKYDEDQLIHIHPRVEGWIDKLYVKAEGNPVKKGQPLYEIYSPALVNAQEEFVLALQQKNQGLIRAAQNRLRALQLPNRAIKELKKTRKVKQNVTFYSPQSGVLDNLSIRQGFYVKPGNTLMSIGVLDQVWVEAEVFEDQANAVEIGLAVTMTLDFIPGKEWQGKVDYIYPSLDAKTRTLKVRLRFDNQDAQLKPNMFAQVSIHTNSSKDTLLVPKEAVIRTGSMNRAVLALGDGRYKSLEVKLGRSGEKVIEILSGLNEGERVVTSAQFLLDSESSKSSDFKRMNHSQENAPAMKMNMDMRMDSNKTMEKESDQKNTVWTKAEINSVMADHRMINATHPAIEAWGWSDMTMNFNVAEPVNMDQFIKGQSLKIKIEKTADGQYQVIGIKVPMDHSQMDHSAMDSKKMDHSQMTPNPLIDAE